MHQEIGDRATRHLLAGPCLKGAVEAIKCLCLEGAPKDN